MLLWLGEEDSTNLKHNGAVFEFALVPVEYLSNPMSQCYRKVSANDVLHPRYEELVRLNLSGSSLLSPLRDSYWLAPYDAILQGLKLASAEGF